MIQNDFTNFSARSYLQEYYSDLNPENKFLLKFYHQFCQTIPHLHSLVEVGGGPTIYQLISVSEKVDSIIFSEFAKSNREEIEKFLHNHPLAWNWDEYISFELKLNHIKPTQKAIASVKHRIQKKITSLISCDIRNQKPLFPYEYPLFDILSMGSVADSISATEVELINNLKNAFSLLKPNGYFIGFFAKNFTTWKQLNQTYHLFPIDEKYIKNIFPKLHLKIIKISNSVPPDYNQEYEGIFAVSAIKS